MNKLANVSREVKAFLFVYLTYYLFVRRIKQMVSTPCNLIVNQYDDYLISDNNPIAR